MMAVHDPNRELQRYVQRTDVLRDVTDIVETAAAIADLVVAAAKNLLPVVISITIDTVARVIETVVVRYAEARSRIERALIDQMTRDFIENMARAKMYAEPIAKGRKELAARKYLEQLRGYGVTGVSLQELMAV